MRSQQSFMSFMNSKANAIPRKDIERLFCAKCRFSTKDTDLFERHVSHHKEVTLSCALCSYVSYSKTESQKHVVSHTGSYPYRCSFCSYGAVRRDYMVKHILRIHKRNAEEGFITDFTVSTPDTGGPPVPDALGISDWPERNDQCAIPNSHVELPSGSQPDQSSVISKTVSQTRSNHARMTYSFTTPCMTNTTTVVPVSKTQFTGAIPSCTPSVSHSLGNTPQVVLRSREANGNLSNSQLSADGKIKVSVSEKLIPKATFPRVHVCSTEPLQQRVGVSEKAMAAKTIPRVQVRAPVELNTPLRALLNTPLSKRNIQMDQRSSQSTTGTNVGMQKPVVLPSSTIKSPLHSSAEKSNQSRTTSRAPVGSSAETSGPLSSVQVELLAPLNQPIQHNKPLTVSCPEEINIPAGCLVELVEVKNVNGTQELELRLIPPNGIPQDKKSNMDEPSSATTGGKLSFKCQVAKGCPVSPSTSATSHKVKQQRPSMCTGVQTITKTVQSAHKPQCSSETPARYKRNPKTKDPEIIRLEGPELSSESLPVISSVFSLCPTPKSTQSISKSLPEMQRWTVAMKEPKDEVKNAEKPLVCSILIKKEETEDKPKGASSGLKETKTEDKTSKGSAISKTHGQVKRSEKTLNTSHSKQAPNLTQPLVLPNQSVIPSNKDDIPHQDKGNSEHESGQKKHSCVFNMYPKVALFRIPSSMLEPTKKLPEAPTQEESLTARPVLYCTLSEQNVSGSPEVAIKLILKRNLCESEKKHQDSPPRKKHKKEKRKAKKRRSSSVGMGLPRFSTKGQELRLTPLKADQRIKLPGPNQPVVVLNHPNPSVQRVSVGVQTLKNYKWVHSVDHEQEQPARKQPSFKMKLKKVHGQKYQVIEFILKGVSEKQLS
ncbi:zinc finger protein 518B-like [Sinocyclocheilus anshuiensis]|uniref:Zinc finger protein 518B-like n=1 Tax=Sinocyclocheilus anshuiensis TaxID=1608454 RepID=A0A671PAE5_9TELE|nr:PREDICTED: zinc finger protein 518B-like [Sinocyclocheilus anshuiensis]